jgi:TPR repeat protein
VLRRQFYLGPEYHATLITGLATVGNPKACFRSGMCLIFGKQRGTIMLCLDPLRRAAEAGHKVAIYALTLLLYRPNSGDGDDNEAWRLLRMVEGP